MDKTSKITNNSALKAFLAATRLEIANAKNKADIENVFHKILAFPYKLQLNLTIYITIVFAIFMACVAWYNYAYATYPTVFFILVIAFFVASSILYNKSKFVKKFEIYLIKTSLEILYKRQDCQQEFLDAQINSFYDFNRGNYANDLIDCANLEFNSLVGIQRVNIVTLRSTDRIETQTKNGSQIHYVTSYRQGVIFPSIGKIYSLLISESNLSNGLPASFTPASIKFQRLFSTVQAYEQLALAKFLEPDVVLMLEKAAVRLKNLTLEFSHTGDMLICQKSLNLLKLETKHTLKNPDLLLNELLTQASFTNLDYLLAFANSLIKQFK